MRRALVPFLVVLAALAAMAPSAGAAAPQRAFVFLVHTDGFLVQGKSELGSGRVRLLLDRRGEVAAYNVKARIGAGTVRARFGRLGSLDLSFTLRRGQGVAGCGWRRGTFRGAIDFHGEHHYADVDADHAGGWFQTSCGRGSGGLELDGTLAATAMATASRAGQVAETGVRLKGLTSFHPPYRFFEVFTESRPAGVRVPFAAFTAEHREGMLIDRGAEAYGGADDFRWDLGAGTATIEPPVPFTGRAFFRREPGGGSRWWGSLRAPILGGRPMRVTGADFHTTLGPDA
jgi:hypothetical protein